MRGTLASRATCMGACSKEPGRNRAPQFPPSLETKSKEQKPTDTAVVLPTWQSLDNDLRK